MRWNAQKAIEEKENTIMESILFIRKETPVIFWCNAKTHKMLMFKNKRKNHREYDFNELCTIHLLVEKSVVVKLCRCLWQFIRARIHMNCCFPFRKDRILNYYYFLFLFWFLLSLFFSSFLFGFLLVALNCLLFCSVENEWNWFSKWIHWYAPQVRE